MRLTEFIEKNPVVAPSELPETVEEAKALDLEVEVIEEDDDDDDFEIDEVEFVQALVLMKQNYHFLNGLVTSYLESPDDRIVIDIERLKELEFTCENLHIFINRYAEFKPEDAITRGIMDQLINDDDTKVLKHEESR
jgi:hypothetical protein